MKVFVTGGGGYLGEGVLRRLAGKHDVRALVRSETSRALVEKLGAKPVMGDLKEPQTWKAAAAEANCSINLAADADYRAVDKIAILTLLEAARSTKKARRVIYTSGCLILGPRTEPAGEDAVIDSSLPVVGWRALHEQIVLKAAGAPISTAVIRPGWVFSGRRGPFNQQYFEKMEYVGDGENRWPLCHLDDVAALYELMVERWHEGIFHAVNESAKTNLIATAASLAAGRKGEAKSIPLDEARKTNSWAELMAMDQPMAAPRARELYGWKPRQATFIDSAAQMYKEWKGA